MICNEYLTTGIKIEFDPPDLYTPPLGPGPAAPLRLFSDYVSLLDYKEVIDEIFMRLCIDKYKRMISLSEIFYVIKLYIICILCGTLWRGRTIVIISIKIETNLQMNIEAKGNLLTHLCLSSVFREHLFYFAIIFMRLVQVVTKSIDTLLYLLYPSRTN